MRNPGRRLRASLLALLCPLSMMWSTAAHSDSAASSIPLLEQQDACPGAVVHYTILAYADNCACQIPAPIPFSIIGYTVVASNGPGNWLGAFDPNNPPLMSGLNACIPGPVAGCPGFPATGFIQQTYGVDVFVPPDAPIGSTDEHMVTISIGGNVAFSTLTTTVIDCGQEVPTLSGWGLILFGLLLMAAASHTVIAQNALAVAGPHPSAVRLALQSGVPDVRSAAWWFLVLLALALVGIVVGERLVGPVTRLDVAGIVASAVVVAYVIAQWRGRSAS